VKRQVWHGRASNAAIARFKVPDGRKRALIANLSPMSPQPNLKRSLTLALVLAAAGAGSVVWAAQGQPQPQAERPDPKVVVESACTSCHGLDFIAEHRKSRADWDFTVRRMIDKGADLGVDEADLVADYLAKTYPAETDPATPGPAPGR
jgi:hypothetical protein